MNFHNTRHRIAAHEANLKIIPGYESRVTETRTVISESWRSGGGCIPHSTNRPTLVRRIVDTDYGGFGMVARRGQAID